MAEIFRIELLPSGDGDCIWIEYGEESRPNRILIDGGRASTWPGLKRRMKALPMDQREFELAVVTHVDGDHITGFLKMMKDLPPGVTFRDVWFNGYNHLSPPGSTMRVQTVEEGDELSGLLRRGNWNVKMNGQSVVAPELGDLPRYDLADGMVLTVVSPNWNALRALRGVWPETLKEAGLAPGGFQLMGLWNLLFRTQGAPDPPLTEQRVRVLADDPFESETTESNGSSIGFLAEYRGKRALFTGDAHAGVLLEGVARLPGATAAGQIEVDLFKVPHHGSEYNVSLEVVQAVRSPICLISANGKGKSRNPDPEAVARIVRDGVPGKTVVFNYRSDRSELWERGDLEPIFDYHTIYPEKDSNGVIRDNGTIRVDLL